MIISAHSKALVEVCEETLDKDVVVANIGNKRGDVGRKKAERVGLAIYARQP